MNTDIRKVFGTIEEKDLCSVIIPVFNVSAYISTAINSILNQTYRNWECIFVDDGCSDDTIKKIVDYVGLNNQFKIIKRPENRHKGPSASRNVGFENSSGEYIQFFDADDLMHPQHLGRKIAFLKENPELDFIVCQSASFNDKIDNITYEWKNIFSNNPFEDHVCGEINFLIHGPMFRRKYLEKQEYLFDESIKYNEEWVLFSRLLQFNPRFLPIPEILVYYRNNPSGSTQRNFESETKALDLIDGYHLGFITFKKARAITPKIKRTLIKRYISILLITFKLKYKIALRQTFKNIFEVDKSYGLILLLLEPFRNYLRSFSKKVNKIKTLKA
jgi:glycosyltransferase involved in cell wall biosynthesis